MSHPQVAPWYEVELQRVDAVESFFKPRARRYQATRISQYVHTVRPVLREVTRDPAALVPALASYNYARMQLHQLWRIIQAYNGMVMQCAAVARRVNDVLSGPYYPQVRGDGAAREAQSELLAGAFLELAGAAPVWSAIAADWSVQSIGTAASFEVKRLSADGAVDSAFRTAQNQILNRDGVGAIWFDMTDIRTPNEHSWKLFTGDDPGEGMVPVLKNHAREVIPIIRRRLRSGIVEALVFYSAYPVEFFPERAEVERMVADGRLPKPEQGQSLQDYLVAMDRSAALPVVSSGFGEALYVLIVGDVDRRAFYRSTMQDVVRVAREHR